MWESPSAWFFSSFITLKEILNFLKKIFIFMFRWFHQHILGCLLHNAVLFGELQILWYGIIVKCER